jgi:hypothetical protein
MKMPEKLILSILLRCFPAPVTAVPHLLPLSTLFPALAVGERFAAVRAWFAVFGFCH